MRRAHIELWYRSKYAFRVERNTFTERQKAERFRLHPIEGQQDIILPLRHPGSGPRFRLLLVKTKYAGSDHRHDFMETLADHPSDDRRINRLGMFNTKVHQLEGG